MRIRGTNEGNTNLCMMRMRRQKRKSPENDRKTCVSGGVAGPYGGGGGSPLLGRREDRGREVQFSPPDLHGQSYVRLSQEAF